MRRAVLAAVLFTTALATPAGAAPLGIRHDRDATAIALAGPDVLVMSEDRRDGVRVVAVPRTGGRARTLLKVPKAGLTFSAENLAASPQRVGAIVEIERPHEYRVYSGPPSGPLELVRRTPDPDGLAWVPFFVSVDGDRLLLVEGIPTSSDDEDDPGQARATILDASGWTPVPWANGTHAPLAIAGPYAAVAATDPQRIELADLATGTPLATLTGTWTERLEVDLEPDGRIALATTDGVKVARPGEAEQLLADTKRFHTPRFAGTSIATVEDARAALRLIAPDGSRSSLGPKSWIHTDIDADAEGVAWLFNGCLRYQAFATPVRGTDRCPSSELALWTIGPASKLRGNTATAQVMCVSSANGRCRGRLVARLDYGTPVVGRGTFDVPVGTKWLKVPVHFDRRTVAKFRRAGHGSVIVDAKMPDGTVGAGADYSSEFDIEVP